LLLHIILRENNRIVEDFWIVWVMAGTYVDCIIWLCTRHDISIVVLIYFIEYNIVYAEIKIYLFLNIHDQNVSQPRPSLTLFLTSFSRGSYFGKYVGTFTQLGVAFYRVGLYFVYLILTYQLEYSEQLLLFAKTWINENEFEKLEFTSYTVTLYSDAIRT